jgi:hypothetical protein
MSIFRLSLLLVAFVVSCSPWNVVYVQGTHERDETLKSLKLKGAKYTVEGSTNGVYEIRYKEKKK